MSCTNKCFPFLINFNIRIQSVKIKTNEQSNYSFAWMKREKRNHDETDIHQRLWLNIALFWLSEKIYEDQRETTCWYSIKMKTYLIACEIRVKKNYYGVMCTSINRNDYFSLFLSGCCSHCFHLSSFTFVQHMIYILSDSIYRALGNDENTTRKQCVVWKIFTERTIFPKIYF